MKPCLKIKQNPTRIWEAAHHYDWVVTSSKYLESLVLVNRLSTSKSKYLCYEVISRLCAMDGEHLSENPYPVLHAAHMDTEFRDFIGKAC